MKCFSMRIFYKPTLSGVASWGHHFPLRNLLRTHSVTVQWIWRMYVPVTHNPKVNRSTLLKVHSSLCCFLNFFPTTQSIDPDLALQSICFCWMGPCHVSYQPRIQNMEAQRVSPWIRIRNPVYHPVTAILKLWTLLWVIQLLWLMHRHLWNEIYCLMSHIVSSESNILCYRKHSFQFGEI